MLKTTEEQVRSGLSGLKLNDFYAECKFFEPGQKGSFAFKKPLPKMDAFLESTNNFEIAATEKDKYTVRKLTQRGVATESGVEYAFPDDKDWVPSVCILACQNCQKSN